jgi:hypothetical protein
MTKPLEKTNRALLEELVRSLAEINRRYEKQAHQMDRLIASNFHLLRYVGRAMQKQTEASIRRDLKTPTLGEIARKEGFFDGY